MDNQTLNARHFSCRLLFYLNGMFVITFWGFNSGGLVCEVVLVTCGWTMKALLWSGQINILGVHVAFAHFHLCSCATEKGCWTCPLILIVHHSLVKHFKTAALAHHLQVWRCYYLKKASISAVFCRRGKMKACYTRSFSTGAKIYNEPSHYIYILYIIYPTL